MCAVVLLVTLMLVPDERLNQLLLYTLTTAGLQPRGPRDSALGHFAGTPFLEVQPPAVCLQYAGELAAAAGLFPTPLQAPWCPQNVDVCGTQTPATDPEAFSFHCFCLCRSCSSLCQST